MSLPVMYSWFWQPAIDGKPGLLMIVDNHPGPHRNDLQLVVERLKDVILEVESQLPKEISLATLKIYSREPQESWFEIAIDPLSRRITTNLPSFSQASLAELWEARL